MAEYTKEVPRGSFLRFAAWCAYLSGIVSAFGILFLLAFFGGVGGQFGTLNDVAVIIQYLLMLPIAFALWQSFRGQAEGLNLSSLLIGLAGMITVIVLQSMLVSNQITFGSYITIVSIGFLVATAWFVITGVLGRREGKQWPSAMGLDILAGLYFGYPFWAFKLGKWLMARA